MAKALKAPGKWHVTSRVIAAAIPGFILVNTFGIALTLVLSNLLGWDKFDAVTLSTVWSFAFYTVLVVWMFSVKRLRTVWLVTLGGLIITGALCYGLLLMEGSL